MEQITALLPVKAQETWHFLWSNEPRPGLHSIPGTKPMTIEALVLPPVIYYIALLFLPPPPPQAVDALPVKFLRNALAITAGILFFRLPLTYFIPQSIGLNYQLGLVGIYGGCRVLDAFFISPIMFNHVPRRVRYEHKPRAETPGPIADEAKTSVEGITSSTDRAESPNTSKKRRVGYADSSATPSYWDRRPSLPLDSYLPTSASGAADYFTSTLSRTLSGPDHQPVWQTQVPEDGWPHTFLDRASWALELELSMRGMGFTWTTADVRHTRKTWLPGISNRLHSIFVHALPVILVCAGFIRYTWEHYLAPAPGQEANFFKEPSRFDTELSLPMQLGLTAALGAFLMVAFSLAHSLFAIACAPLAPSPFAFFPPLYTTPIWEVTSVRKFWGYGWHRLFARLFLVYGVWPGEWVERKLTGKKPHERADIGKIIGGFLSSAFVHSFSVRCVMGGDWVRARGKAVFFIANGFAVVFEEGVRKAVVGWRKRRGSPAVTWYDAWVGRAWWITVLLFSGRNFARGLVDSGLVREMMVHIVCCLPAAFLANAVRQSRATFADRRHFLPNVDYKPAVHSSRGRWADWALWVVQQTIPGL